MRTFLLIWSGEVASLAGSGLTSFALGIWIYQHTGSTTLFALNSFCAILPLVFVSPLVGPLIDRWERRRLLIASICVAALGALFLLAQVARGSLEPWQIYLATTLGALARSFQLPAWMATTALLVDRRQLGRANGLVQLGQGFSQLAAPLVAGALLEGFGLTWVIFFNLVGFLAALVTLLVARIPHPTSPPSTSARASFRRDMAGGWRFILARPPLLGLMAYVMLGNFLLGLVQILSTPLVLAFSTPKLLGAVLSTAGAGMLLGGMVMSFWGGPKRRIAGLLGALFFMGIALVLSGLAPSVLLIGGAAFVALFCAPIAAACNQAIWQVKTPLELQGRVFAIRTALAMSSMPLAHVLSGPLADDLFTPLLAVGGPLAGSAGALIGVGPGRGIALLLIVAGILTCLGTALGLLSPRLRRIEDGLPDAVPQVAGAAVPFTQPS